VRNVLLHLLFSGLMLAQPRVVAFGKEVASDDTGTALAAISDGYAAKHGLTPTEEELAPVRKMFPPQTATSRVLDFPFRIVQSWKLNRVWWGKHGGGLALSAFGVHLAAEAMLKEVEAMEKAGEVKFVDPAFRRKFFAFYGNYRGDGYVPQDRLKKLLDEGWTK